MTGNKKFIITVIIVGIVLIGALLAYYFYSSKSTNNNSNGILPWQGGQVIDGHPQPSGEPPIGLGGLESNG